LRPETAELRIISHIRAKLRARARWQRRERVGTTCRRRIIISLSSKKRQRRGQQRRQRRQRRKR